MQLAHHDSPSVSSSAGRYLRPCFHDAPRMGTCPPQYARAPHCLRAPAHRADLTFADWVETQSWAQYGALAREMRRWGW